MGAIDGKTLYIFIDESGNLDFSEKGTKYYVLTSISTTLPLHSREGLLNLKYELISSGHDVESFHATEDKQFTRDAVFEKIKQLDDLKIDSVVAQKNKTYPELYCKKIPTSGFAFKTIKNEEKFYHMLSENLLKYIFKRHEMNGKIENIVIVLGSIFTNNKRETVLKSLKQYLKVNFKKPFYIYFHKTSSDINCQLADYCCWATFVKFERGETRPYIEISNKITSCFEIFKYGKKAFY